MDVNTGEHMGMESWSYMIVHQQHRAHVQRGDRLATLLQAINTTEGGELGEAQPSNIYYLDTLMGQMMGSQNHDLPMGCHWRMGIG